MKSKHGGNIFELSRRYGIDAASIIDFSANINPLGYSSRVRKALIREIDSILNYPDVTSFELVSGLSQYHGIVQDSILVGNGSTEFIYLIPVVFKPKKALIVVPSFSEYENGLKMINCEVLYFQTTPETDFSIDIPALCSTLEEGFDILYLCNPANPTGCLTATDDIRNIITCARKAGAIAVIDEVFIDFIEEVSVKRDVLRFDNLIVIRSVTKFFGIPGLRIGYIIASQPYIEKIRQNRPPWSVNALGEKAALEALSDKGYIKDTREYVRAEREFLRNELDKIPGFKTYNSAANFLLVFMESQIGMNAKELAERLAQHGILIRDCSNFQSLGHHYFRIAVKRHEENIVLIDRLKKAIRW
ncbi:MAG: threonine-phosphate decarboxylase CobD [Thermodesulfobacteriota bacterium]|nr:threonine-phosphate decarboxylase CobD [Thermodesulfobacteriota bacterium]